MALADPQDEVGALPDAKLGGESKVAYDRQATHQSRVHGRQAELFDDAGAVLALEGLVASGEVPVLDDEVMLGQACGQVGLALEAGNLALDPLWPADVVSVLQGQERSPRGIHHPIERHGLALVRLRQDLEASIPDSGQ